MGPKKPQPWAKVRAAGLAQNRMRLASQVVRGSAFDRIGQQNEALGNNDMARVRREGLEKAEGGVLDDGEEERKKKPVVKKTAAPRKGKAIAVKKRETEQEDSGVEVPAKRKRVARKVVDEEDEDADKAPLPPTKTKKGTATKGKVVDAEDDDADKAPLPPSKTKNGTATKVKRKIIDEDSEVEDDLPAKRKRLTRRAPVSDSDTETPKKKTKEPEFWQPYRGTLTSSDDSTTTSNTLGIARIASSRAEDFLKGLRKHSKTFGQAEISSEEVDVGGGEKVTDIAARFQDESTADDMEYEIEGVMVLGRILQGVRAVEDD